MSLTDQRSKRVTPDLQQICSPPSLYTLCLHYHFQFHLLDFDVIGERREAAQG